MGEQGVRYSTVLTSCFVLDGYTFYREISTFCTLELQYCALCAGDRRVIDLPNVITKFIYILLNRANDGIAQLSIFRRRHPLEKTNTENL